MVPESPLVPTHPTAQRLLDAAVHQLDSEGEAGLRVDAVVAEAGVTIPVLYHHYGNREGLVRAAHVARLTRDLAKVLAGFEQDVAQVRDRTGMVELIDGLLEYITTTGPDRAIRTNVLGATYGRPDLRAEIARLQRAAWVRFAGALEEPQRRGWIRADLDLTVASGWVFGLFLGRALLDIQDGAVDAAPWHRYNREAVHLVLFGEAPPG